MKHIEVFKPTIKNCHTKVVTWLARILFLFFSEEIIVETQGFMRCNFFFIALNLKFS